MNTLHHLDSSGAFVDAIVKIFKQRFVSKKKNSRLPYG